MNLDCLGLERRSQMCRARTPATHKGASRKRLIVLPTSFQARLADFRGYDYEQDATRGYPYTAALLCLTFRLSARPADGLDTTRSTVSNP